jgi:hypothetical protein
MAHAADCDAADCDAASHLRSPWLARTAQFAEALAEAVDAAKSKAAAAAAQAQRSAKAAARPTMGLGGVAAPRAIEIALAAAASDATKAPALSGCITLTVSPVQHHGSGSSSSSAEEAMARRLSGLYAPATLNDALAAEAAGWHMDMAVGPLALGSVNVTKALFGIEPADCEGRPLVLAIPGMRPLMPCASRI